MLITTILAGFRKHVATSFRCMIAGVLLVACSDSDDDSPAVCKLTRMKFGGADQEFVYDGQGQLSEIISLTSNSKSTLVYDGEGKIIKRLNFDEKDVASGHAAFLYDDDNNIITATFYLSTGEANSIATYEYDDNHRVTGYKVKFAGAINFITHLEFSYYANGNLQKVKSYEDGVEIYSISCLDYDANINPITLHPFFQFMTLNYSPNNMGREIGPNDETVYTYEYNDRKLPTSITYEASSSAMGETKAWSIAADSPAAHTY
jgi:YD repeat-containing protein